MADNELLARARAKNDASSIRWEADTVAGQAAANSARVRRATLRIGGALVLLVGLPIAVFYGLSRLTAPGADSESMSSMKALMLCQSAIKSMSINPGTAVVPVRPERGANGMRSFTWDHADGMQLQNGFGAMLGSTARCVVDLNGRLAALEIDGKAIPVK